MEGNHPYVRWAIDCIENYVKHGRKIDIKDDLPEELLTRRAACFVTLHKFNGDLRGCIGTIEPVYENLAIEIRENGIAAATRDYRFSPVTVSELDEIQVSVDVLSEPEPVESVDELDPNVYGVIVVSGWKKGVLLPAIEGVETVEEQLRIAKLKAGIYSAEPYEIYRFTVERYF
ncbi:AmmeMemoRadiSam system protein A [Marinitoga aeolica]|uniref:AmmeMemoRadiSam system protein A n=1 Tax=Marinitoga aeolica TaxID=2809031 RepID=A0ABY8PTN5_9BACT|nr:AmmeMemoRadiSam system protein A [Marinitoga aeolica]WGS65983.1 AmmeMemoRadiSam system protein A [Marinitoga aeolica]